MFFKLLIGLKPTFSVPLSWLLVYWMVETSSSSCALRSLAVCKSIEKTVNVFKASSLAYLCVAEGRDISLDIHKAEPECRANAFSYKFIYYDDRIPEQLLQAKVFL